MRLTYRKLYRVYYTTYFNELHEEIKRALARRLGVEIIDYPSRVNPEFRFVEVLLREPGREGEIKNIIDSILGCECSKVEWVDTEVG